MDDIRAAVRKRVGDPSSHPASSGHLLPRAEKDRRGTFGAILAALVAGGFVTPVRAAEPYPTRPIRLVVPFAAGGGTDLVMRAVADAIAAGWKATIVIENKPGAGTTLGASAVAAAPADGYTLLANTASFLISPHMMTRMPYDPRADFQPVALVASSPHVLAVGKHVPARTLPEFIAWIKAQPSPPTFASFGVGSSSHLGYEILRARLGLAMVHVPYRGAAPALVDLLGGRVDTMLADLSTVAEHVKTGEIRALAIAGRKRADGLPDVPTADEAGVPGFTSESWFGLMVRSGTAPEIVERWNAAIRKAVADPNVRAKLDAVGIEPAFPGDAGGTVEAFAAFLKAESDKYADAIRRSGARME